MISRLLPMMLALAPVSPAGDTAQTFSALRAVDLRLATIAYRLTTANAALCRDRAPTPGWAIHSLGQYDASLAAAVKASFGFETPIAVEAVVPRSPAALAGLRADDSLVSVNGVRFATSAAGTQASSVGRDAAVALIAGQPADRPLIVEVVRGGSRITATVPPAPGCRSAFEILLGPGMEASSDGRIVQIGVRFFERYGDDEIAVVVAHELAHIVLRHRARLEAAGVKWGLFAELGRNGRLFRQTEDDADRLSVALLYNAGFDPASAPRFWRAHGGEVGGGPFRSRTHASPSARARAIDAAVAAIPVGAPRPYAPPILATRDAPLR